MSSAEDHLKKIAEQDEMIRSLRTGLAAALHEPTWALCLRVITETLAIKIAPPPADARSNNSPTATDPSNSPTDPT